VERLIHTAMKCAVVFLSSIAGLLITRAPAQTPPREWVALFDGRSTTGWRSYCREEFPARCWVVEDGALKRLKNAADSDCSDIMTVGEYGNFELELDYRISPDGNSGIKYLVPEKKPTGWDKLAMEFEIGELRRRAQPGYEEEIARMTPGDFACFPIGFEYQLIDDVGNEDALAGGTHITGAVYDLLAPSRKAAQPAGEFNHVRLVVSGNHVEHWLNGIKVLEFERGSRQLEQAIERSKFRGMAGFGAISRGHIVLQDHGSEIWFRNIRIRELKPWRSAFSFQLSNSDFS